MVRCKSAPDIYPLSFNTFAMHKILSFEQAPLVLVGHSMGGLVIKRAFILAKQKEAFSSIADRIRAFVFIGTPHRGAKYAHTLTRLLSLSPGQRPFVTDLHPNSVAVQSINEDFPLYCQDLHLFSFLETLPTSFGVIKNVIVDEASATLGYTNEKVFHLNANHRGVCKYDSTSDPNYRKVRDALVLIVNDCRGYIRVLETKIESKQQKLLRGFLSLADKPEDDFKVADGLRLNGSCEWLVKKQNFREWQKSPGNLIYWIAAKPGAGKTVLSGKVISHLKNTQHDCSFYFFDYRSNSKSTITSFLLSIAWQMSLLHSKVLSAVVRFCEDDRLNRTDHRIIWRVLFLEIILSIEFEKPQYWVIDALDECKAGSELVSLLLKLPQKCQIHIFLTCRDRYDSYKFPTPSGIQVVQEEIGINELSSDISLYVHANMHHLPELGKRMREHIVATILDKSAGCFLWVNLVLRELKQIHTRTGVRQVLEAVPSDMDRLYSRILDSMSQASYEKWLAKAILTWTVCSVRTLTTAELYSALQTDLDETTESVETSVASTCGQLVCIDSNSRVQLVHQTAREFLLKPGLASEFAVDHQVGHTRLALACLRYLNDQETKRRHVRKLNFSRVAAKHSSFANYAYTSFFHHINHVPESNDAVMRAITDFLTSSNVLTWVEYISQFSNLDILIQASNALRNYAEKIPTNASALGKDSALLYRWSKDLVRLVTKFGRKLAASPSSIFSLIPPFCPSETALRKQHASPHQGITVVGLSTSTWDDSLGTIVGSQEQFLSLASSKTHFAIGMFSGKIAIYNQITCQEGRTLQQHGPVRTLQFGHNGKILASAGLKSVCIWDLVTWGEIWTFEIPQLCLSLTFADEDQLLMGAFRDNRLISWDILNGEVDSSVDWTLNIEDKIHYVLRRPTFATFSLELNLLAVIYKGHDVLLWDMERSSLYATLSKDIGITTEMDGPTVDAGALSAVFCSTPKTCLLAVLYADGDLALFDIDEGEMIEVTTVNSHSIACSPDGRILACADTSGVIQLFEFETLKLIYRIYYSEDYIIKGLAFSGTGHNLLDIRGSQCNVWDSPILPRRGFENEEIDTVPQDMRQMNSGDEILITSITTYSDAKSVFCGKEDGSVCLYAAGSGLQNQILFVHKGSVSIRWLHFDAETKILTSVDSSSRIMSHRFPSSPQDWQSRDILLDTRTGIGVDQILGNAGNTRLLVSSVTVDTLWSISAEKSAVVGTIARDGKYRPYRWANHPYDPDHLILITDNILYLYEWATLERVSSPEGVLLDARIPPYLGIKSIASSPGTKFIATRFEGFPQPDLDNRFLLWDISCLDDRTRALTPTAPGQMERQPRYLIGYYKQRLVYLDTDDWICSADVQGNDSIRHFFIPADWLIANTNLMIEVTTKGDIVFVKRGEIAVIKRGLNSSGQISTRPSNLRPSFTRRRLRP